MPVYFTYITPQCEKEAKKYGLLSDIQKLANKIEETQEVGNLWPFPRIFRKKPLGRNYRLIIGEVPRAEVGANLLIFWHVYPKSSDKYTEFQNNSQAFEEPFKEDCKHLDIDRTYAVRVE